MSFLDKLKGTFGKAKDKSDALVDQHREHIPDDVEKKYDKVSDAAEKVAPGTESDMPAESTSTNPPAPPTPTPPAPPAP